MLALLISTFAVSCGSMTLPGEPAVPALVSPLATATSPVQASSSSEASTKRWRRLVARDDKLSFTDRAGADALAEWAEGGLDEERRAVVVFTMGASPDSLSKERLVSLSRMDTALTRRAAMLALGKAGLVDLELMREWMVSRVAKVRETVLLAGLLSGSPEARLLANAIEADKGHAMYSEARGIVGFVDNPDTCTESDAVRWYLNHRFAAAKSFGLIDGQSWSAVLLDRVSTNEAFLDEIVLMAATKSPVNGVKDHLMHALLEGKRRTRVGAAVIAMPEAVNALFEHGFWEPNGISEWDALLNAIWEHRLEEQVGSALVLALEYPRFKRRAAASIARLEDKSICAVFQPSVLLTEGTTPGDRGWALEFLVYAGGDDAAMHMRGYLTDSSPAVRAKARVALLRIGAAGAYDDALEFFSGSGNDLTESVLIELCRQAKSGPASRVLHELVRMQVLGDEQRVRVGASLILAGRRSPLLSFSEDARSIPISGELGALTIKALGHRAFPEDLELLVESFPLRREPLVNLAAGRILVERGMPEALPFLQTALWRGPWDRSILACGIMIGSYGNRLFVDELESPPSDATSEDLRRVGFALGEWGGLASVEVFARRLRTGSSDPILQGAFLGALSARTH